MKRWRSAGSGTRCRAQVRFSSAIPYVRWNTACMCSGVNCRLWGNWSFAGAAHQRLPSAPHFEKFNHASHLIGAPTARVINYTFRRNRLILFT